MNVGLWASGIKPELAMKKDGVSMHGLHGSGPTFRFASSVCLHKCVDGIWSFLNAMKKFLKENNQLLERSEDG